MQFSCWNEGTGLGTIWSHCIAPGARYFILNDQTLSLVMCDNRNIPTLAKFTHAEFKIQSLLGSMIAPELPKASGLENLTSYTWLYLAVPYLPTHGCTWLHMTGHGYTWLYMAVHGCT